MIINKSAKIVLINGTEYDWKKSFCFAYQMICFKFPETIKGSTAEICDLKWSDNALITNREDYADVRYELVGTNYSFTIQARIQTGFDIFVFYNNLSNLGNNFIRLEWLNDDNGFIQFYLCGRSAKFISTASFCSTNNWMQDNLDVLGDHFLKNLSIPGSHNSGSSVSNGKTAFATPSNTQTQSLSIYQQLMCGIRYFDIRPVISNGTFYTGHYALVGYNYQGANGQSIKEIVSQINSFVACNNELIILSISHGLNLDLGNIYSNRKLNQQEYNNLFIELLGINYRLIVSSKEKVNLTEKNLNYFIGNKRSAVCIILNDLDDLDIEIDSAFYHQGFFCKNEFPIYDKYSNTNDLNFMIKDQLNKMMLNKKKNSSNYFLFSWTLTQQIWPKLQIAFGQSIFDMAITANSNLFKLISIPKLNKYSFIDFIEQKSIPNVIYQDFVTPDLTCGRVVVINGTRMSWKKTYHHTYQMNHFKFPDSIEPGQVFLCYIEWNQQIGKNHKDDSGEVIYEIDGVGSFTIAANAKRGFTVYVKYDNLSNLESNNINLGFVHNGYVPFCISGVKGKLISTNCTKGASSWMSNYLDLIGHRSLKDICLSGSHDSGMSSIHSPTAFVNKENTQTQSLEIKDQLNHGIRYFDIRPIIGAGNFHTGHYSRVGVGWQGARGQNMESIIQQLNEFTSNKRELIIINLSHSLNTDLGNTKYRSFTQEEYDRLFNQLKNINNLFMTPNEKLNLVDKPVNYFLGNGSAVIIILNDNVSLNSFHHRGFYTPDEFPIVDSYANTDKLDKMVNDQLDKLSHNRSNGQNNYFLLSWILTLQTIENVFGPSIEYLADQANSNLFKLISDLNFKSLVKKGFPNIIIEDYVTSENTAIALAINLFKDENFFVTIELDEIADTKNPTSSIENAFLKIYFGIVALCFGLVSSVVLILCYFNKPNLSNYF